MDRLYSEYEYEEKCLNLYETASPPTTTKIYLTNFHPYTLKKFEKLFGQQIKFSRVTMYTLHFNF